MLRRAGFVQTCVLCVLALGVLSRLQEPPHSLLLSLCTSVFRFIVQQCRMKAEPGKQGGGRGEIACRVVQNSGSGNGSTPFLQPVRTFAANMD